MNFTIVSSNIEEALEELQKIRDKVNSKNMDEAELKIQLQHVYHHLNVAWNIRDVETERYRNITHEEFENWGEYPNEFDD